ncbi:hypothetical protein CARUB_v10010078mg [Capsella rubella]|uniref:RING-type E3 ubiquitin transferase n=1 Tax=Capsella rubella TaxID=81985 RepID=R0IFG9_9BRAS|nr:E3 ubiquitin-protein ligase SPL1 isoform X2 [Capsella rubella]EOA37025.1 hypothetical protein CARUB_v10010078mg [Capsella rubella]
MGSQFFKSLLRVEKKTPIKDFEEEITPNAVACCLGGAAIYYLLRSWKCKRQAQILNRAVRVEELQDLEDLIGNNNTSGLLVAVCGKVGSNAAFMCNRSGLLAVSLTEKAKLVFPTEDELGFLDMDYEEILLSHKTVTVPWFLEDHTGRVNVVGFYGTFRRNVFAEPMNELCKEVEIVTHICSEDVLEIGRPLSIVAKAFRGEDGSPTIKALPSLVFDGYICVDKEVYNLQSQSGSCMHIAFFLAIIGVLLCEK